MAEEKRASSDLPGITVVIPTLNSANTLRACLESVRAQQYPASVDIVISDGGSTDATLAIAAEFDCTVVANELKTGEAGKARGLREATGEVIALIDSDNILPGDDWMTRMAAPFADTAIAGSEPISYEYRREDAPLTRYCALMGMNDPLCYFLRNYDRLNLLTGRWTGLCVSYRDRGDYLEVTLREGTLPTMGANGFLVRRSLLQTLPIGDYLFDIDIIHELVARGHDHFAKVKVGIIHLYGKGLAAFARKQLRRVRDFRYYQSLEMRSYPWSRQRKAGIARFVVYCVLVVPLLLQSLHGYLRRPDPAWFLHAPACLITLAVYGWGYLESAVRPREQARATWRQ